MDVGWAVNPMAGILTRGGRGETPTHRHRGRGPVKMGTDWRDAATSPEAPRTTHGHQMLQRGTEPTLLTAGCQTNPPSKLVF